MGTNDPYASIKDAVEFHERCPIPWEWVTSNNISPVEMVEICCKQADEMLADPKFKGKPGRDSMEMFRGQMDSPLFLRWVAGKLGAM